MTEKIRTMEADLNAKAQKRAYEMALANQEAKFKEDLQTLQTSLDVEKGRLKFLKVNIDHCTGDTIIDVDGVQISVHRLILADKSLVFRKMFASGLVENLKGVIRIAETTHQVMQAVITYCYTTEITFSSEVPPDEVLKVAHKYEIGHLKTLCDQELCRRIDMKNLPHMLKVSRQFEAIKLQQESAKFFKENFDKVQEGVLQKY
ncbi:unnamed protein product [Calypogeia fissa]